MTSHELVLALLRNALWNEKLPSVEWSDGDWAEIFGIAYAQGIHTVIYDAFRPASAPPNIILSRWAVEVARAEFLADRITKVAEELSGHWEKNGVEYAVLKGMSIARLYPHPRHRLSGDIDFYFPDESAWKKAYRSAKKLSDVSMDSDGDYHYVRYGIVVEHHRSWCHLSSKAASGMQARIKKHVLCPEDDLLMLSSHILRHAMIGGAGLRQLTDLAVATRTYNGQYNKAGFCQKLASLGLSKWAGLLAAVMNTAFRLSPKELPIEPDTTHLKVFMDLVYMDGNLGKENRLFLRSYFKRLRLFMKICPGEYFARWMSLVRGHLRRTFEKIGKNTIFAS